MEVPYGKKYDNMEGDFESESLEPMPQGPGSTKRFSQNTRIIPRRSNARLVSGLKQTMTAPDRKESAVRVPEPSA